MRFGRFMLVSHAPLARVTVGGLALLLQVIVLIVN